MKFSAKEDIDAPIEDVFLMLSEIERYERSAMRRGAEVRRTSDPALHGLGMTWDVAFQLRGRQQAIPSARLSQCCQPQRPDLHRFLLNC